MRLVSAAQADFFFGAMSPYSWFAAERIGALLPRARWRPLFLGGLFHGAGRQSWGLTEERAAHTAECERRALEYSLGAIRWPADWPTSDLVVARAMTYAQGRGLLEPLALAAMRMAFLEGADLAERENVLEAGRRVGIETSELERALAEEEVKLALRAATDEALARGVFGVPTLAVGGELFWGDDRLLDAAAAAS
jgi:2-hydroxychromene-2-carboxylate isomerase